MDKEKLKKIKALADDARGNPQLRAVAQAMYQKFLNKTIKEQKVLIENDIEDFIYFDWEISRNGNPYKIVEEYYGTFQVTIYPHKFKDGQYNWCIYYEHIPHYSKRSYESIDIAKRYAWHYLQGIKEEMGR
jgi:hypothetical protein